jgi:hypothetical protein
MGAGIAEIDGRAVAEIFGDMAVEARHGRRDRALKRADQVAHVLGIELGGKRCRADEVAEHDRQLAAIGGLQWFDRITAEFPDCAQNLQPVSERNAHLAEVPLRQLGQNISVDRVFTKDCLVLAQAEAR